MDSRARSSKWARREDSLRAISSGVSFGVSKRFVGLVGAVVVVGVAGVTGGGTCACTDAEIRTLAPRIDKNFGIIIFLNLSTDL
jgi:hypothetical protein